MTTPPRTIRIGEYDVPEPLRWAPDDDAVCYGVDLLDELNRVKEFRWDGHYAILGMGILHKTREAAQLHAEAIISLSKAQL
jgi:hypothetical protein